MIEVTKLNDEKVTVNADLIEMIEEVPETVITFTNGKKIFVKEKQSISPSPGETASSKGSHKLWKMVA